MFDWLRSHESLLWWLFAGSIASLLLAALLLPVVIVRLPADYFVRAHDAPAPRRTFTGWLWFVARNVLGALFVLAGLAMLVLPGQGLLTILIGLLLLELPGKRAIERRILGRPRILQVANRMRARRGRPPLLLDAPPSPP